DLMFATTDAGVIALVRKDAFAAVHCFWGAACVANRSRFDVLKNSDAPSRTGAPLVVLIKAQNRRVRKRSSHFETPVLWKWSRCSQKSCMRVQTQPYATIPGSHPGMSAKELTVQ